MDTYQPIFDAVRSRLSNCDVGAAIQEAFRGCDFSHHADMAKERVSQAVSEYERPSAVYRPSICRDGNQWCALYGENLEEGVAGFGDSPSLAMQAFDNAWYANLSNHTGEGRG